MFLIHNNIFVGFFQFMKGSVSVSLNLCDKKLLFICDRAAKSTKAELRVRPCRYKINNEVKNKVLLNKFYFKTIFFHYVIANAEAPFNLLSIGTRAFSLLWTENNCSEAPNEYQIIISANFIGQIIGKLKRKYQ